VKSNEKELVVLDDHTPVRDNRGPQSDIVTIVAYTDGACSGNPGPGGWGVYAYGVDIKGDLVGNPSEISGQSPHTTNNQMELEAAIQALRITPIEVPIHIYTDSKYVHQGITSWIHGWIKRGWKTSTGGDVSNKSQWIDLRSLVMGRSINWSWVKGHSGDPGNEKADALACRERDLAKNSDVIDEFEVYVPPKSLKL